MDTYNDNDERLQSRKGKTIGLLLSVFVVLSLALLISVVYLVINENSEKKFDVLNSKTKRSICSDGNCDEGLNQIQHEIVCPPVSKQPSICLSKDCTLTAATLLSAMDTSVDPCDDFYQFSCSNFIRKNLVPDDKKSMTTFLQYEDQYNLQLKNLIESYNSYGEPEVVYRLQEAYHVCINRSYDREKEIAGFKDYVINVLDGWPMAVGEQWKPKRERLDDYFAHLLSAEIKDSIIQIEMKEEFDETSNTTRKCPVIRLTTIHFWNHMEFKFLNSTADVRDDQNQMTEYEKKQKEIDTLKRNLVFKSMELFGKTTAEFVQGEMEGIFKFMEEIEKIGPTLWISEDTEWMTIEELNDFTNGTIDWFKIIEAKLHGEKNFNISDKLKVSQSLKKFPEVMNKIPRRSLTNYISLKTILNLLFDIGLPDFDDLVTEINIAQGANIKKEKRWKKCINWIMQIYPLVLTRMYVKTFVDISSKQTVDHMIKLIQDAYKKNIHEIDWLDENTKERALMKADAIKRYVGYPDFIFNDTAIEEEYSHIPIVHSSYLANEVELNPLARKRQKDIISSKDEERWFIPPLQINAFYYPSRNSIWFPSGILQLPFFGENRLAAINFGMIGSIIGHEIGHAFDNDGSTYNEIGEKENWWAEGTDQLFKERSECYVNQYDNFCPEDLQGGENDPKICINGFGTVGENMADNTGLKAAFNAYKAWVEENGEEKRLPGLEEYSTEQLFFISFGYIWCENIPTDKWLDAYRWNPHSSGKYRVLGTLSNNEVFREAFNCPVGNMNRGNESCHLW